MIRISRIEVSGTSDKGAFLGALELAPGLNVFSAHNSYGKSLATTGIGWCLGLETMFGLQNNDASRFPPAVRDVIDIRGTEAVTVRSSRATVRIERDDGKVLTIERSILGGQPEYVDITEGEGEHASSSRLLARKTTMADETGGLQRFLFSWIGLPRVQLMTMRGTESDLYLENLAPLFYVDQNEGWTDLQALQVYRYGIEEVAEAAVEYLLGASDALRTRFGRQRIVSREAHLKGEAQAISERVVQAFQAQGFPLSWSTHGSPFDISKRWSKRALLAIAREDFHMDVRAEQRRLSEKTSALRKELASGVIDPADRTASSEASQQVVELKSKRHELRSSLRTLRTQLEEQRGLLATIEHRMHSSSDVLRLKRDGVGRLEVAECPTCHRDLDPATFDLTSQSQSSVSAHIQALDKERVLIRSNIESIEADVVRVVHQAGMVEEQLRMAENALATVNLAVGGVRERLGKVASDLAAAERESEKNQAFEKTLSEIQDQIDAWVKLAVEASSDEGKETDLAARRQAFVDRLRKQLLGLGHSAINSNNAAQVRLDDRYVPYLGPRRIRSLGSASDHPRLVAAYTVALAQAARYLHSPHPGFVILDEPLQQNPDDTHRELMLRFLETTARDAAHQLIVLTFLKPAEVSRLEGSGVNVRVLEGEHFLKQTGQGPG